MHVWKEPPEVLILPRGETLLILIAHVQRCLDEEAGRHLDRPPIDGLWRPRTATWLDTWPIKLPAMDYNVYTYEMHMIMQAELWNSEPLYDVGGAKPRARDNLCPMILELVLATPWDTACFATRLTFEEEAQELVQAAGAALSHRTQAAAEVRQGHPAELQELKKKIEELRKELEDSHWAADSSSDV